MAHFLAVTQEVKHKIVIWSSHYTCVHISHRIQKWYSNKNLYTNIHNSTIHNSQKGETIQMSIIIR